MERGTSQDGNEHIRQLPPGVTGNSREVVNESKKYQRLRGARLCC